MKRRLSYSTEHWKKFSPVMTSKRDGACAVALDSNLFVMGGCKANIKYMKIHGILCSNNFCFLFDFLI